MAVPDAMDEEWAIDEESSMDDSPRIQFSDSKGGPKWKCKDGRVLFIKGMEDPHLFNCTRMLLRKFHKLCRKILAEKPGKSTFRLMGTLYDAHEFVLLTFDPKEMHLLLAGLKTGSYRDLGEELVSRGFDADDVVNYYMQKDHPGILSSHRASEKDATRYSVQSVYTGEVEQVYEVAALNELQGKLIRQYQHAFAAAAVSGSKDPWSLLPMKSRFLRAGDKVSVSGINGLSPTLVIIDDVQADPSKIDRGVSKVLTAKEEEHKQILQVLYGLP